MRRPESQITNAAGQRQIRAIFEPLGGAVREVPQDTDVGIDFEIEVFEDYKSTGVLFKVQLKSSEHSKYSEKRGSVKQEIKQKHLAYYCDQLADPVIILHADTCSARTFWLAPQLTRFPPSWTSDPESDARVVLDIPQLNELPQTIDQLIRTGGRLRLVLGTRVVMKASIPDFLGDIRQTVDEESLVRELRDKSDALSLSLIQQLFLDRKFDEAKKRIGRVLQDPQAAVENRFWASMEDERIEWKLAAEEVLRRDHSRGSSCAMRRLGKS